MLPLTLFPGLALQRLSNALTGMTRHLEPAFPFLKLQLKQAEIKIPSAQYLAINVVSTLTIFVVIFVISFFVCGVLQLTPQLLISSLFSLFIAFLIWMQNLAIPHVIISRKVLSLERNLIPALSDMLVQIHAGVPLFDILTNIGNADYGAVSAEFKHAVRRISSGENQVRVLEDITSGNPSVFFRRVVWQVVNALKTGASVSGVLSDAILRLGEEQVVQIQQYGGRLNSLTVFYLMSGAILPAMFMVGMVVVSFFVKMSSFWTTISFIVLYLAVVFLQILFFGLLRSKRPNLL